MPQWIQQDLTPDISSVERQYITLLREQNKDDSLRHRIIVQCFHQESGSWREAFFYEPLHCVAQSLMSEFLPVWEHTHQTAYCECLNHYHELLTAYRRIESADTLFVMEKAAVDEFCKQKISHPAKQAIRKLTDRVYATEQAAANSIYAALTTAGVSDEDAQPLGSALLLSMRQTDMTSPVKQNVLRNMQASLTPYKAVDLRPAPTFEPCPLCHLPRKVSFAAMLLADKSRYDRILNLLDVEGIRVSHLPRVLQAIELWFFTTPENEDDYEKKMFPNGSMTGMMMRMLRKGIEEGKAEILSRLSSDSASTSTTSTGADSPPPPLPDAIPPAN